MAPINLSDEEIAFKLSQALVSEVDVLSMEFPHRSDIYQENPRPAAVLIPLARKKDQLHIIFTKRTQTLPEHSGQVAFPGGQCDPQDYNREATALRESKEEIGLEPKDVKILGRLNDFLTVTNYQVTPIVGMIQWPYNFRISYEEVSKVFTIPFDWLAETGHYEIRKRILPPPYGKVPVIFFNEYDGEVLWGASARITLHLVNILLK
jgi:8-oxo-dGTP pyrophosphatase MutT (NUDIX family)